MYFTRSPRPLVNVSVSPKVTQVHEFNTVWIDGEVINGEGLRLAVDTRSTQTAATQACLRFVDGMQLRVFGCKSARLN